ncbi:hypothetical protein [Mycobacterium simulans]|uniref:hypothetical protein n=1 Tax=Mycobacterium simulans TaxID=627089 RepID=UPI00174A72D6|nr:hypothetical protein [Mycobacterium simulans]
MQFARKRQPSIVQIVRKAAIGVAADFFARDNFDDNPDASRSLKRNPSQRRNILVVPGHMPYLGKSCAEIGEYPRWIGRVVARWRTAIV